MFQIYCIQRLQPRHNVSYSMSRYSIPPFDSDITYVILCSKIWYRTPLSRLNVCYSRFLIKSRAPFSPEQCMSISVPVIFPHPFDTGTMYVILCSWFSLLPLYHGGRSYICFTEYTYSQVKVKVKLSRSEWHNISNSFWVLAKYSECRFQAHWRTAWSDLKQHILALHNRSQPSNADRKSCKPYVLMDAKRWPPHVARFAPFFKANAAIHKFFSRAEKHRFPWAACYTNQVFTFGMLSTH